MARSFTVLTLLVALSACSGGGTIRSAAVVGDVTYLERIALPPDARVHVTLRMGEPSFDMGRPVDIGQSNRIIAQHNEAITRSVPVPFTLTYQLNGLDPSRPMVVEAWISAGDQVLFASTETKHVQVGASAALGLTLRRPRHVAFACADGSRPAAAFPVMGELAFLESNGAAPVALRAQRVASGFHYGGEGYSLRGKGQEVSLRRPTGVETLCQPTRG